MTEDELKDIERGAKYGTTPGETQALVDEIRRLRDPQDEEAWAIFADGHAEKHKIPEGAEFWIMRDAKGRERTFRRVTAWSKEPTGAAWEVCYVEGEKARP